ncbi:MAG TPA: 6-bladed beta-propeller [Gemmatimonadaceae bacterium]|nr:6-bladed beta-propeller [Gemmatimonadaceae bacterium]
MRARFRLAGILLVGTGITSACGDVSAALKYVQVDTLPGGIPRTLTSQPIDSGRWQLVLARDIQPPELDSAELLEPRDVAIADDGSVLVVDARPTLIKVYDPNGRHVRSIGREGSGPGEFRAAYIAVRGDTLVVQDPQNSRATTFDWRTGAMLSERRTACCYFSPIGIDGDGRAVVRSINQPTDSTLRNAQGFVRFSINARTADTIFVLERQDAVAGKPWLIRENVGGRTLTRMAVGVPLQPRAHYAVDPTGGFVTGWSADYVLRVTRSGRDTVALFGREYAAEPVSNAEKQRIVEQRIAEMREGNRNGPSEEALRASFDAALIPDTRPAYDVFAIDAAGRRWVRLAPTDTNTVRFDLFDREGRWLDVVQVSQSGWPRTVYAAAAWGRNEVAVILEGEDGRPLVRVYRIVRASE